MCPDQFQCFLLQSIFDEGIRLQVVERDVHCLLPRVEENGISQQHNSQKQTSLSDINSSKHFNQKKSSLLLLTVIIIFHYPQSQEAVAILHLLKLAWEKVNVTFAHCLLVWTRKYHCKKGREEHLFAMGALILEGQGWVICFHLLQCWQADLHPVLYEGTDHNQIRRIIWSEFPRNLEEIPIYFIFQEKRVNTNAANYWKMKTEVMFLTCFWCHLLW